MFRISIRPMIRAAVRSLAVLTLALLASCANPQRAERKAERMQLVESAAGNPLKSFHFWNLDRFETLDRTRVLIWTRPNKAYLLDVEEPCVGLELSSAPPR